MNDYKDFLWVEKYRPTKLEDFVLSEDIKSKIQEWINDEIFPHLILHGTYGTGKTSIVKFLINNFDCDVLEINAKGEGINIIREKVSSFLNIVSFQKFKVVVFHEGDQLSRQGQEALKEDIEINSDDTRIIFTTNHIERIDGAIASRCLKLHVEPNSPVDVAERIAYILSNEGIEINEDQKDPLWKFIKKKFPDIRNIIKGIQNSVYNGVLSLTETRNSSKFNDILSLMSKVNSKNKVDIFYEIREIVNTLPINDLKNIYEFLFYNLDNIYKKEEFYLAVNVIANFQYKSSFDVDLEINISAMIQSLIELKV